MENFVDVTIEGLIYSLSGFGEILRNIVLTLHEMGVHVRLIPHGGVRQGIPKKQIRIFNELKARYDGVRRDSAFLYFGTPLGCTKYPETYCISWTMFETQDTPYDFVRHLNPMDEVWLPSKFCYDSFTRAGLPKEKARIMPLGVDTAVFTPKLGGYGSAQNIFKFGTVVGWSERKGVGAMLQSYLREFDRTKDNALFIIRGGYYPKDKIMAEIDTAKREASKWMPREKQCDIYLCYHIVPLERMPDLYRMFDCLVYPSLGEGFCTVPETLIITQDSIKHIKDCKIGDKILTHTGNYEKVIKRFERLYDDDMIDINPYYGGHILLTPNHNVLYMDIDFTKPNQKQYAKNFHKIKMQETKKKYSLKWVRADKIKPKGILVYPIPKYEKDLEYLDVVKYITKPHRIIDDKIMCLGRNQCNAIFIHPCAKPLPYKMKIDDDLLHLFGLYIAEGCGDCNGIHFAFHIKEKTYTEEVINFAKKFNFTHRCDQKDNKIIVSVNSRLCGNLFVNLFGKGAKNKKILVELMHLPLSKIKHLLKGMVDGDGYVDRTKTTINKHMEFTTTSYRLVHQFLYILKRFGYLPSIKYTKRGEYVISLCRESIFVDKIHKNKKIGWSDRNYIYVPIRGITKKKYKGFVYNLAVEKDESYTTPFFTVHNCLPAMESMSSGIPCIITRATAPLDFCNDENSYLIDVEKIDKNPKCEWITAYYRYPFPNEQTRGATFAIPSQPHLQKLMRHVYEHRDEARKKGEKARMDICRNWDIRLICEQVKQRLMEIQATRNLMPARKSVPEDKTPRHDRRENPAEIRKGHPGETATRVSADGGVRTIVG